MTTPLKLTSGEVKRLERNLKKGKGAVKTRHRSIIEKAMRIYQKKYGGSLVDISILFVNVTAALTEAAEQESE